MAQGEPNIEGAIKILVDLLTANSFTMTRSPYENNFRGLVDALIDFKEGFPTFAPLQVGFNATAFQDVTDGDEGKIYSGIANRQFTRKFTISDDIVVKDGELKDGMLRITLERVIPEEKKPRMITIK